MVTVGILAAQGDFAAHQAALSRLGVRPRLVRKPGDFSGIDALVLPGGESTAMLHAIDRDGLAGPLGTHLHARRATFATCAGAILLARRVTGPSQRSFEALDIDVERNSYGSQIDSFGAIVDDGGRFPRLEAIFIRAPRILRVGKPVEVLARVQGDPVLVREGLCWAATFHPELGRDDRVLVAWLEGFVASGSLHVPRIGPRAEILPTVRDQHGPVHVPRPG